MAIFTADTIVTDPKTGQEVAFGSLSNASQRSILAADEAAADQQLGSSFTAFKQQTGTASYTPVTATSNETPVPVSQNVDYPNAQTTYAPDYSTTGGYVPGQVDSRNGGYDPNSPYLPVGNSIGGQAAISPDGRVGSPLAETYDTRGGYIPGQEESTGGGWDPNNNYESDIARRNIAGLPEGGGYDPKQDPAVAVQTMNDAETPVPGDNDWRVRISLAPKSEIFYKSPTGANAILAPLLKTDGVIFPYLPSITVTHSATYNSSTPTHSNYSQHFYNNSEVNDITITGEFTVQSIEEGQYLMAAIYFFRAATKMFFGQGNYTGNPPPIVFLDGYGSHYFPHVPCVLTNFSHVLPNDVDYIQVPVTTTTLETTARPQTQPRPNTSVSYLDNDGMKYVPNLGRDAEKTNAAMNLIKNEYKSVTTNTRVPTNSSITITLRPMYSRKNLHDRFNLEKFADGTLLQTKGYGGFL